MIPILYIAPGPVPPPVDPQLDKFQYLGPELGGDVLHPVWLNPVGASLVRERGSFRYKYVFYEAALGSVRLTMRLLWFYFREGLRLHKENKYRVIVNCGAGKNLLATIPLKYLTGAKLILEIRGHPTKGIQYGETVSTRSDHFKAWLIKWMLRVLIRHVDRVKLLYPTQFDDIASSLPCPVSVFHDFMALALIEPVPTKENRVIFLGWPWYLKGVDLLIRAFNSIQQEFPEHKLFIIGGCKDRTPYEELRAGNSNIEFMEGVKYDEALRLIASSQLLVLPSRTEAMGRVLIEAMASEVPVVASRVDGIPFYVRDEVDGLLFDSEDVSQLATQMRRVLENPELARTLGRNGRERALSVYTEHAYASRFKEMVQQTVEVAG